MNMKLRSLVVWVVAGVILQGAYAEAAGKSATNSAAPPTVSQVPATPNTAYYPAEDWKGKPEAANWNLTVLTGLALIDATPGFGLMGAAARKIIDRGFVPDINNSVWIEVEMGPVFAKGSTSFMFSGHLRWDFVKDDSWTFYALGGLGGLNASQALGDNFELYPRFGIGALWNIFADFTLRAEISHELMAVGAQFDF